MCTSTSAPDAGGFHLFLKHDDDKDTQSDGDVCDLTEFAEKTMDRREGKRRASSSAHGFDVRQRTQNLGPMGTPEGGGGAETAISTAVSLPFQHASKFQHRTKAYTRPPVLRLYICRPWER